MLYIFVTGMTYVVLQGQIKCSLRPKSMQFYKSGRQEK